MLLGWLRSAVGIPLGLLSLAVIKVGLSSQATSGGMFERISSKVLAGTDTRQKNYGIAVSDVDNDGELEWIIAGFGKGSTEAPNLVLKYEKSTGKLRNIALSGTPYAELRDERGAAIGVCACDIDGDGREEIYFLNTNGAYGGRATYGDKLFKWRNGRYVDLFSDPVNRDIGATMYAGRSVACVDRRGNGKYAFALATYSWGNEGNFGLIEMDETDPDHDVERGHIVLRNVAREVGIDKPTGGRGITVGPIVSDDRSDLFFDNEDGPNFLFKNRGDGTFLDVATTTGIEDRYNHGRGVALADFNADGLLDVVYGNWMGPHRLFLQSRDDSGKASFTDAATPDFARPSAVRTVMAADFDNDGNLEVLMNNIYYRGKQPNKLYRVTPNYGNVNIQKLDIGDALEPDGYGTGGAICDMDGDGVLEVILSHGESNEQPVDVYRVPGATRSYLRILPRTQHSAPARGALVTLTMDDGTRQTRVIDAGSGYLCQMEPVAHFGLGRSLATYVHITWPDGTHAGRALNLDDMNKQHDIAYPVKPSSTSGNDMQSLPVYSHDGKTVYLGQKSSNNEAYPSSSPGTHFINSLWRKLLSAVVLATSVRAVTLR